MIRERSGDDIPPWALRAVERAGRSNLLRTIGAPLVRADSSAYLQLSWTAANLPNVQEEQVIRRSVHTQGDPSVAAWKKVARLWPHARVVTAAWNALDGLANGDLRARQVAGYITTDSVIHIGVLPEAVQFGSLPENSGTATLAFRQGRHASQLLLGVLRGDGRLVVPEGLGIVADDTAQLLVPIAVLADTFPGTPVI